jgi:hypothetical protein
MIERSIASHLKRLAGQYPIVTLTGPRQSGKTTLCRMVFPDKDYVSLENPDTRQQAQGDPRGFLSQYPAGVILDEIQRVPELVSYLQEKVDTDDTPGRYILTGSQQFEVSNTINQSLAGRTALLRLLPFTLAEAYAQQLPTIDEILYTGFYPRIHDKKLNPTEASSFYVETYVQRDVRSLLNVKDLNLFERFIKLCAAHAGQLVNYATWSNSLGLDQKTIKAWLSILEASYIVFTLSPHSGNYSKRIVKTPRLYFYDVGIAAYLLDIRSPSHVQNHPLRGALFENLVVAEMIKQRFNAVKNNNFFFYRDRNGLEVDVVAEEGNTITPVEIKSSQTFLPAMASGLEKYQVIAEDSGKTVVNPVLVYGGTSKLQFKGIRILPLTELVLD